MDTAIQLLWNRLQDSEAEIDAAKRYREDHETKMRHYDEKITKACSVYREVHLALSTLEPDSSKWPKEHRFV